MARKQTQQQFIIASSLKHHYKYDYSKIHYVNNNTLVTIICPVHGEFKQRPRAHIGGKGCYRCGREACLYSTKEFIDAAIKVHGNVFDYSKIKYIHSWNKIKIICKKHGEFNQQASQHLRGSGCPTCHLQSQCLTNEVFIKSVLKIHNNIYDYSKVAYTNSHAKIVIICQRHGEFLQKANSQHVRSWLS